MEPQEMSPEEKEAKAAEQGITAEEFETKLQEEKTARTAELEERAAAEGKTVEELEAEITAENEELAGLSKKYDGDPQKMLKALKSSAQEATRLKDEQKSFEERIADADSRLAQVQKPAKPTLNTQEELKQHLIDDYSKKFPNVDEEVIAALVQTNMDTAAGMEARHQLDKAQTTVSTEKQTLSSDPFYEHYQKEIDDLVDKQPPAVKSQPGIVQRCRDMVIGRHARDIEKAAEERGLKKGKENKQIVGEIPLVGGARPPVSGGEGKLSSEQEKRWSDMGGEASMSKKDFLEIDKFREQKERELKDKYKR